MNLSKQELKQKISDSIKDNDELVIELLEDIEDSMLDGEIDNTEFEEIKTKYDELKIKYKERFLNSDIEVETLEEKEVIDVKEI